MAAFDIKYHFHHEAANHMSMEIIGSVDKDRLYCSASFTKFVTTYTALTFLSESYDLAEIIDDEYFFDRVCRNQSSRSFLSLMQDKIGGSFTIRDLCSYYAGLPYTFDLSDEEMQAVDAGEPYKHHSVLDEERFLSLCRHRVTMVYRNRCKFHYSELSIIFFAYLIEKAFDVTFESLYQQYVIDKFALKSSIFARKRPANVYAHDISDKYDYPSIAILDHGYFCYSNGFYTTLNDAQVLISHLLEDAVFHRMTDLRYARAASGRLMNGLAVEIRLAGDDVLFGYEGLSYSDCNIWAYSVKQRRGYLTTHESEDAVYDVIYGRFGYHDFDPAPPHAHKIYQHFLASYPYHIEMREIPALFQGAYHRVRINEKELDLVFHVKPHSIVIRNPDEVEYPVIYVGSFYRVQGKDKLHGSSVQFYQSKMGSLFMFFDGNLYRKIS